MMILIISRYPSRGKITDGQIEGLAERQTGRTTDERVDRRTDGLTDGGERKS
jgi:hypothetical protein